MADSYYPNPNAPEGYAPQQPTQPYPQPLDAASARDRVRNQAPQQPPTPDFTQMPSEKKSNTGLIIGIVAGCLLLVVALASLATSMLSRTVEGLVSNYIGTQEMPSESWDSYGFDWDDIEGMEDLDEFFDKYHDFDNWDSYDGYSQPNEPVNDPSADDGELHDGFNPEVLYTYETQVYQHEVPKEHVDAYDMDLSLSFYVEYPQLEGDIKDIDKINAIIRDEAMSFVNKSYLEPEEEFVSMFKKLAEEEKKRYGGSAAEPELFLVENLESAITYNSGKLISIVFSDHTYTAVAEVSVLKARTLNINLETGEVYTLDDVMTVTEGMVDHWLDNIDKSSAAGLTKVIGRDVFKESILGKGDKASRTETNFFVDANGKVNLNVNWWLGQDEGGSYGWWDVTLTDEEIAAGKKDSSFWDRL